MRNNTSDISDFKFSTQFLSTLVVAAISVFEVSFDKQNNPNWSVHRYEH